MDAPNLWLFGYGSLVSPASVERTLGRPLAGFAKATLHGFRRGWNATMANIHDDPTDKYFVDSDGHRFSGTASALGIYRSEPDQVNGAVFAVDASDLPGFDSRERRYDRIEITGSVDVEAAVTGSIITYLPMGSAVRLGAQSREAGTDFVSAGYVRLVEEAFVALGGEEIDRYRASTDQIEASVIEMTMVWDSE
jgi:hypothetical protein